MADINVYTSFFKKINEDNRLIKNLMKTVTDKLEKLHIVDIDLVNKEIEDMENSLKDSRGLPEVPGSYFTPRHIVNATRKVINEKDDPRETLIDYTRKINEELLRKRQEFNLVIEE